MSAAGDMQVMTFSLDDAITGNRDGELISGNCHSIGSYDRLGNRERDSRAVCSGFRVETILEGVAFSPFVLTHLRHHSSFWTFLFLAQFCAIFYKSIMCTGLGGQITG